jgi:hypothetical protein
MPERPYSETHGRRRGLASSDLVRKLYPVLRQLLEERVFAASLGEPWPRTYPRTARSP